jgi:hypothetical protein
LSAVGADKLDEPKLLSSKAKNKFNTCNAYKQLIAYCVSTKTVSVLGLQA